MQCQQFMAQCKKLAGGSSSWLVSVGVTCVLLDVHTPCIEKILSVSPSDRSLGDKEGGNN